VLSENPTGATRTLAQRGRGTRVSFLWLTFLWTSKER
jgi:hypothetical protein